MTNHLEISQIVNTFGIKGYVKVKPFTDDITRFDKLKNVYIQNKKYEIESVKYHKNLVLLKIKGIDKMHIKEKEVILMGLEL
jgi:16S rRNA processing protein RimM